MFDIKLQVKDYSVSDLIGSNYKKNGCWRIDDPYVTGVSATSSEVCPGYLFFALPGVKVHGANFFEKALKLGALGIVTDLEGKLIIDRFKHDVPIIIVERPRLSLALCASKLYCNQPEVMIAVTGTNGKTSVSSFVRQLWELFFYKAVNIGTLGVQGALEFDTTLTTPEPAQLHKLLHYLESEGVTYACLEASSHGLEQFRLDGTFLSAAGFTNLSRDHLDYHIDESDYFSAKAGLFDRVLQSEKGVVINIDDKYGHTMRLVAEAKKQKVITIGTCDEADIKIDAIQALGMTQNVRFVYLEKTYSVKINLLGEFQVFNALMAAALVITCGEKPDEVFSKLNELQSVPGRMEFVAEKKSGGHIYVDYAHTPSALANALKAIRPHVFGKLFVLFGAGGDRDVGKRCLMGETAQTLSDVVYVSDDNPRYEDAEKIRADIMQKCPKAIEIGDRAQAILTAVSQLSEGDALLIAGKGHEMGQEIEGNIFPFSDIEQVSMSVSVIDGVTP